jgi:hypothetical protein
MITTRPARRRALGAALLAAGLLATGTATPAAHAALVRCSSDPILVLSNGVQVQMTSSYQGDASTVTMITYTLHAPSGTTLKSVTYTGGLLAGKETVVLDADQSAHGYSMDTYVNASTVGAGVSVSNKISPMSNSTTSYVIVAASGTSNQHIATTATF